MTDGLEGFLDEDVDILEGKTVAPAGGKGTSSVLLRDCSVKKVCLSFRIFIGL